MYKQLKYISEDDMLNDMQFIERVQSEVFKLIKMTICLSFNTTYVDTKYTAPQHKLKICM